MYEPAPDEGPFTLEELNTAIDNLKRNKAGGPDNLITELFKVLNRTNRERLLDLYNEIYETTSIPDHFNEAEFVQIYKPGKNPENYSSYRPIALLNTSYKILAKMIQERLRTSLHARIVDYQYGYSQHRSTAEPIFIARRVQDLAERQGKPLYILALDYSKAFDSIPHPKLLESLQRLGASDQRILNWCKPSTPNPALKLGYRKGLVRRTPPRNRDKARVPLITLFVHTNHLMSDAGCRNRS